MAKNKTHIDELFRDGLKDFNQPLNGTEWDRLSDALGHKRKRRFFIWWLLIPALVATGAMWLWYDSGSVIGNSTPLAKEQVQEQEHEIEQELEQELEQEQKINIKRIDENELEINSVAQSNNSENVSGKSEGHHSPQKVAGDNKPTDNNNFIPESRTTYEPSGLGDSSKRWNKWMINLIPKEIKGIGRLNAVWPALTQLAFNSDWKIKRDSTNLRPLKPYIGLNFGGLMNNQNLGSSINRYTDLRNGNEAGGLGMQFGLNIGTDWRGLDVETGLLYSEKSSRLNSRFTYQVYDSIPYIDINGDTTWLPWDFRDTTITRKLQNPKYQYLGIPLTIGKSFNLSNKSAFEVGISGQLQFLVGASGTTIDTALSLHHIHRSDLNTIQFNGSGYLGYRRELSENLDLALRLNMGADVLDMTRNDFTTQRFRSAALSFTIRRKL